MYDCIVRPYSCPEANTWEQSIDDLYAAVTDM